MSAYLTSLVLTSALVGVCSYLSYSEKGASLVKMASSLIVVYMMITPVSALIGEGGFLDGNGHTLEEYMPSIDESEFSKSAAEAFEDGVKKYVCEKFSLSDSDVRVSALEFDCIGMKAEKVKIILCGGAAHADARGIEYEINSLGLGKCEVEISVG